FSLGLPAIQPWHRPAAIGALTDAAEPVRQRIYLSSETALWHFPTREIAWIVGATILCGIGVRFVWLVAGLQKLKRFRHSAAIISASSETGEVLEEMRGRVGCAAEFRLSADVNAPVTFGLKAPTILLPEEFPQ